MQLKYEEASQVASDAVGGMRTVASFCAEKNVMKTYEMKCESPIRQGIREGVVGGLGLGFSLAVFYFAYALCFYVGAKFVQQGKATFPEVFKVQTHSYIYPYCIILFVFHVSAN
jgi:ATP-binding cassette subfamily B (MDR/TAP) protein 1